jgi:hypothetical protein
MTIACTNPRCPEVGVPKDLSFDPKGLPVVCGACGAAVPLPDPPERR